MIGWICRAAFQRGLEKVLLCGTTQCVDVLPFSQHAKRARTPIVCFGDRVSAQEFAQSPLIQEASRTALADFRELLDSVQHIDRSRVKRALSAVKNL